MNAEWIHRSDLDTRQRADLSITLTEAQIARVALAAIRRPMHAGEILSRCTPRASSPEKPAYWRDDGRSSATLVGSNHSAETLRLKEFFTRNSHPYAQPNTRWLEGCVALDEKGFVRTGTDLEPDDLTRARWPLQRHRKSKGPSSCYRSIVWLSRSHLPSSRPTHR